jgi:hypothetical protein
MRAEGRPLFQSIEAGSSVYLFLIRRMKVFRLETFDSGDAH